MRSIGYQAADSSGDLKRSKANEQKHQQHWKFAEPGLHTDLERSKDLSLHVTDEVFNAASHMIASFLSTIGAMVLIAGSSHQSNAWKIISFSIYGASMINLFVSSTLHHGLHCSPKTNHTFRMLDYVAIYPFIAGTFTPLCLVCLHSSWIGWVFLGVVWGEAIFGISLNTIYYWKMPKWMSLTIYMSMGWTGAFLAVPLFPRIGYGGILLLGLGGITYTVGGVIFIMEKPNPIPGNFGFHEIWHIFVIAGAGIHWAMMFCYVLPIID
mmetsp:Transcript_12592/g.17502  ORF Transcript_12592/g.17502 Transcript_12592/m.17502 type:complete len:267 (+) Transcript_12592:141-941(+)